MTQIRQPPYEAILVQPKNGIIAERWQEWVSLLRRYLRAELITATAEVTISSTGSGFFFAFDIAVTGAEQGDTALVSLDTLAVDGILLSAQAQADNVRVTVMNHSGSAYAVGPITARASVWKH